MIVPWLALVALFSLAPAVPRVPGVSDDAVAIAGHLLVYGVLAVFIYRLHAAILSDSDRHPVESATVASVAAAVIGLGFEWAQLVFTDDRTFEAMDVIANTGGALSASLTLLWLELRGTGPEMFTRLTAGLGIALAVFSIVSYAVWDPALAYEGDHWHTAYRVVICGESLPLYAASPGNVHTHGTGFIHVHPARGDSEGKNANLAAFFESVGGELTNTSLTLPSGETYTNGDLCPDGTTGRLSVSKQRLGTPELIFETYSPAKYLPRNFDRIIIEFSETPTADVSGG
jgi:hypothetical protein